MSRKRLLQQFRPFQYSSPVVQSTNLKWRALYQHAVAALQFLWWKTLWNPFIPYPKFLLSCCELHILVFLKLMSETIRRTQMLIYTTYYEHNDIKIIVHSQQFDKEFGPCCQVQGCHSWAQKLGCMGSAGIPRLKRGTVNHSCTTKPTSTCKSA